MWIEVPSHLAATKSLFLSVDDLSGHNSYILSSRLTKYAPMSFCIPLLVTVVQFVHFVTVYYLESIIKSIRILYIYCHFIQSIFSCFTCQDSNLFLPHNPCYTLFIFESKPSGIFSPIYRDPFIYFKKCIKWFCMENIFFSWTNKRLKFQSRSKQTLSTN